MTMLAYLLIQVALLLTMTGLGFLALPSRYRQDTMLFAPWVGLSLLLTGLPLVHLAFPMGNGVIVGLVGLSLMGCWLARKDLHARRAFLLKEVGTFLLAILILSWPLSMMPALHPDWGRYYQQIQNWSSACPAVPGLGNLHGRYALPGTSFLAASLLDFLNGNFGGARILGGYTLGLFVTTWVVALLHSIRAGERFRQGFLVALPPLLGVVLERTFISVAAPDLLSAMLVVLWGGVVLQVLANKRQFDGLVLPLGTALVLLKFSNLSLVVGTGALLVWKARWIPTRQGMILFGGLVAGWLVHNWVQSGWPIFPFGIALGNPDWGMDVGLVEGVVAGIRGWARLPGRFHLESLNGYPWFEDWLRWQMSTGTTLVLGVIFGSTLVAGLARARVFREVCRGLIPEIWMACVTAVSLGIWFLSAPDERFALGLLWLLGAIMAGVLFTTIDQRWIRNILALLVALWMLPSLFRIAKMPIAPLQPRATIRQVVLPSGLVVWTPEEGRDQVWNAPLPATPELYDIEPRGASLCDGFRERRPRGSVEQPAEH